MGYEAHAAEGGGAGLKVLLVEDDFDLAFCIEEYLALEGFRVTKVGSALAFYREIDGGEFDVAILDLSLPDQDGLVLARYLRQNTRVRVVMLTARSSMDDRRMGYEAGAEIYLVKPVDLQELAEAVAKLGGRQADPAGPAWRLKRDEWVLIAPGGEEVNLTSKEFEMLRLLGAAGGEVVGRKELLGALEYPHSQHGLRAIESLVYRLRKKAAEAVPGEILPLKTSHGLGYAFTAPLAPG